MKKLRLLALLLTLLFVFVGCDLIQPPKPIVPTEQTDSVSLDRKTQQLDVGEEIRIRCIASGDVTWTSSDSSIVTVTNDGTVRGISGGTATVTATCGKAKDTCTVTVTGEITPPPIVSPTGNVRLDKTALTLQKGETTKLTATASGSVTWTSDNPSVATVAEDGTITGISGGTATITVTCGNAMDTCTVTVEIPFDSFGMPVLDVYISDWNVVEDGIYNTYQEVGIYIYLFHKLPSNYNSDSSYVKRNYTPENKLSTTKGTFYNNEGLLPNAPGRRFTECDIGYTGGGRNALRIVFSNDWLIFYTNNHYSSFSILRINKTH